jgi:hypothetical protein
MSDSTALERRQAAGVNTLAVMSDSEINRSWRLAEALAASGAFPATKDAAKAFAIMLVGHDLGLSPTQALMGVYIVEGKPMVGANLLGSFVKQMPGYDYKILEHDEGQCSIVFFDVDGEAGVSTFTMDDAKKAGLVKAKSGWEKYPKAMLFARALSQGVRWYCPDCTGGIPVYVEGEIVETPAITDGDGSGEVQGLDLGLKVEKVLARAAELGHAGLADRATAEVTLGGRSPEIAAQWARDAEATLDTFEVEQDQPAIVVTPGESEAGPEEQKAQRERIAEQLEQDAVEADEEGKADEAVTLRAQAAEMRQDD